MIETGRRPMPCELFDGMGRSGRFRRFRIRTASEAKMLR